MSKARTASLHIEATHMGVFSNFLLVDAHAVNLAEEADEGDQLLVHQLQ
jgi:hypothetical protein